MNIDNFVFEKENAFSKEFCDEIVKDFELCDSNFLTQEGESGRGIDYTTKKTQDLDFFRVPQLNSKYSNKICTTFNYYLSEEYLNKLPYQNHFPGSDLFYGETFYECLQVQRYRKNEGHYNAWHIETGNFDMSKRLFVFILYLSDVFEGGETELLYSGKKTSPRKGKLMIAPSTFPYVHKGHMPLDNDKYILTTWLSFKPQ